MRYWGRPPEPLAFQALTEANAASAGGQRALGELGELSRSRVILSEFKYNRGVEIYGEAGSADYIYQVVEAFDVNFGHLRGHRIFVPLCGAYRIDDCGRNAIDPE